MPSPGRTALGKSTFMKILTGEIDPTKGNITRPKKMGVLRQDQFAFDKFRVIDTVIMGNAVLWKALEERDALYAKPHDELTNEDGMRLGEPGRHRRRRRRVHRGSRCGCAAGWLGDRCGAARAEDGRAARRAKGAGAAGAGTVWQVLRRCCWTSRPTTWTWIRCTG